MCTGGTRADLYIPDSPHYQNRYLSEVRGTDPYAHAVVCSSHPPTQTRTRIGESGSLIQKVTPESVEPRLLRATSCFLGDRMRELPRIELARLKVPAGTTNGSVRGVDEHWEGRGPQPRARFFFRFDDPLQHGQTMGTMALLFRGASHR